MATALCNARVLLPLGLRDDICVVIEGARIRAVSSSPPADAEIVDLGGKLLLPGFIDCQVNGGGGALFNTDPSVATIATIAAAHRRFGTTGLLPTLISDDLSVVERGIAAVDAAIAQGVPGILGIHIEGPFLNPARRGIHAEAKLRRLEDDLVDLLAAPQRGKTLVTLAPERATPAQIARLVDAGVIVAAGHSDADYETVRGAIDAGLTGFTHLFNAMSQLANRAPGMVGAALEDDSTWAGIIVDGHHLHPATVRVAVRAKRADRLMLVTDAMPSVGSAAPTFELQGRTIRREGDILRGDDGVLAGSTLTMAGAVANMIAQGRVSLRTAVTMASATPAAFLGLADRTGTIAPGFAADLVLVDDDLIVQKTWIAGEVA
ncbi:N-acetylglucosamine 6-phosphate deacetylase [Hephaestia caeni]|uniref:N-acetylglucosamine 6-phosphate deacetylase n=1 Tax=Hephaestia caeni TaxID=645617 RepID=A0A397P8S5_9SPHN|nr:N-acetylglucosamine-6-phosphate deacetylase [Hephaestia caeni]RIA44469.1 N-acetylglucosamine 6-phosphate deacetylase [Hephaestia caeni]